MNEKELKKLKKYIDNDIKEYIKQIELKYSDVHKRKEKIINYIIEWYNFITRMYNTELINDWQYRELNCIVDWYMNAWREENE